MNDGTNGSTAMRSRLPARLFGMRVRLKPADDRPCCANNSVAVIDRPSGLHAAQLKCASCGAHRGWLSQNIASWLTTVINKFGAPDAPIVIRRGHVHAPDMSETPASN
jgi:hypothetical protein